MLNHPHIVQSSSAWPRFPVILSVPHAGRDYPSAFTSLARLATEQLLALEDRFADRLIERAAENGFSTIVAKTPRAWIDLNRAEREYDPDLVMGGFLGPPIPSLKVRGGLGIIPRRMTGSGDIWRDTISADAFEARLADHHRPYHNSLATMLETAVRDFGIAILLDIHSMPPLTPLDGRPAPQVVIGDRFGKSADKRFTDVVSASARHSGLPVAINAPYAGGHILDRHSHPSRGIHALQIEIDRSLYLDQNHKQTASGLAMMQAFIESVAHAVSREALGKHIPLAAE